MNIVNQFVRLMPKQLEFVRDDTSRELLYSGAFGAGKTRALCLRAIRLAQDPRSQVGIVRKNLSTLKVTTLKTLLQADGDLPPVLPPGSYQHHLGEAMIRLNNGGTIQYFGCDDETKVGSRPLTDVLIDEGIELDEREYVMLLGRIRVTYEKPDGTKNRQSIATVTNPGSPTHFLYDRFFVNARPGRRTIETSTGENYFLPAEYIKDLSELTGTARARYYEGRWVAYEGQIYPEFDPAIHEVHHAGPFQFYVTGMDWGFRNPASMRVHGCWMDSKASHVVSEYYRNQVTSDDLVKIALATRDQFQPNTFIVDPSAADLIQQLRRVGLSVIEANNDVDAGIRCITSSLACTNDGNPWLTMEPTCKDGNREYPLYRWKPHGSANPGAQSAREQPVKEFDHALDADRYARMFITRNAGAQQGFYIFDPTARKRAQEELQRERLALMGVETYKVPDPTDERLWPTGDDRGWQ